MDRSGAYRDAGKNHASYCSWLDRLRGRHGPRTGLMQEFGAVLKSGDTVERYTVLEPLGGGGLGEVYRARDGRLQREVALKILRLPAGGAGATGGVPATEARDRVLREARAAAALHHPNVVAVYDVGEFTAADGESSVPY